MRLILDFTYLLYFYKINKTQYLSVGVFLLVAWSTDLCVAGLQFYYNLILDSDSVLWKHYNFWEFEEKFQTKTGTYNYIASTINCDMKIHMYIFFLFIFSLYTHHSPSDKNIDFIENFYFDSEREVL